MEKKFRFILLGMMLVLASTASAQDNICGNSKYIGAPSGYKKELFVDSYGALFISYAGTTLIRFPPASTVSEYRVPASCTTIARGAFKGCKNLKKVIFERPYKLDFYIGDNAFDDSGVEEFEVVTVGETSSAPALKSDNEEKKEVARYSVNGVRMQHPQNGINIVKYNDGSVEKVTQKGQ